MSWAWSWLTPDGEFGPVYQQASDGILDWEKINEQRYAVLECQLNIYDKSKASWSIWLYKDIGFQGMVYVGEETAYRQLLAPLLKKKRVRCTVNYLTTGTGDRRVGQRR